MGDGPGHVAVLSVEVVVGQAVAHPGNVAPRQTRFACQQWFGQGLHRLADLDEPNPHGVVDQPVGQVAPLEVAPDGGDRVDDVL